MATCIDQGLEDVEGAVLLQGEGGQIGQGGEGGGQLDRRGSFYRDPTTLCNYYLSQNSNLLFMDQQHTDMT